MKTRIISITLVVALSSPAAFGQSKDLPKFSLPLDCTGNTACFLQNLMDMDLSPRTRDPLCSNATYNGHKGTDIRIRDLPTMLKGVPVLAMADGIVLRLRDGVADRLLRSKAERIKLSGIECGNGMVIDHGKFGNTRWTTQTCHMAKGSLRVKRGDKIKRGQIIGMVGLSGATQFPHVHVSLRGNGKLRDLLTDTVPTKKPPSNCNTQISNQLLTPNALSTLQQMNSPLLSSGFSDSPMNGLTIMQGKVSKLTLKGPLIFYAHFINLKKGDSIRLIVKNSNGVYAEKETRPLTKHQATYTTFVGRRKALKKGSGFSGVAELWRGGKAVFTSKPVHINF